MACRTLSRAVALAAGLAAMSAAFAQQTPPETIRFVKSRVLVQPRAGLADAELDKLLGEHGGRRSARIGQINVHVVDLPPQANELAVARALARNPHVKFAEVDRVLAPNLTPNDYYFANAWHHPRIGTPTAWDTATGDGVVIAILDSGVDGAHPDLASQMVAGWNFYDGNNNTADVFGHGTSVAGVAAAAGNNATGVAAVNLRAKIMPIRVTDLNGYASVSGLANGIAWAADRGARVASISFQGAAGSATIQSAAQYMRGKGGVVVVAAGNSGGLLSDSPSDAIVAVAATDPNDARASFSSYGPYVDIAAPGTGIWTTTRGGGYGQFSGTSASTPVVSGLYALMMSANPKLQPSTLDGILFSTAVDLGAAGRDDYYGWGRVDAAAAVAKAKATVTTDTTAPATSITSPTGGTLSGVATVNVSATDNVGVTKVELYFRGALFATDTTAPYAFSIDTTRYPDGAATLQSKAYDAAGNAASSAVVSVTVANDTVAPVITSLSPASGATVSGTVTVSATATDNRQVAKMSLLIDGKEVALSYGSSLSYSWNTGSSAKAKGGGRKGGTATTTATSRTLTVRAWDAANNMGTASATVTVQ